VGNIRAASVIVVTYNSAATIASCLNSIPRDCEVLVVDQSSRDDSIAIAKSVCGDATVISAGGNRGFGAGCNLGAANAHSDVLIFLNPDASFAEGAVRQLVQRVRVDNALVGPLIVDEHGCDQTRARFWSTPLSILGEVCLPTRLNRLILKRDIPPSDVVYRRGGRVPYVQGTCMAVGAANFRRAGGFDERLFLYHEEEVLARRLQRIAVPAVLAYNYLQSRNKRIAELLTGFSNDVLANITSRGAVKPAVIVAKPTAAPAKPAAAPVKS